jgi:hypothetical protein
MVLFLDLNNLGDGEHAWRAERAHRFTHDRDATVATPRSIHDGIGPAVGSNEPAASLRALETAASMLSKLPEKKVMVYISSGVSKAAIDNQDVMEATVKALMKANVVMYPLDTRELSAAAGIK